MDISLQGVWEADIGDGRRYPMVLPGTLDENGIGHRDARPNQWHPDTDLEKLDEIFHSDVIATRFTRKHTYEGPARLTKRLEPDVREALKKEAAAGKRIFLEAERARVLRLFVDGQEVPHDTEASLSTPHVFEVTGRLREDSELTLVSDNSYPGLPHDAIVFSSAATDETQTNWNGAVGYLRLRTENPVFLRDIRVLPMGGTVTVKVRICADRPWSGILRIRSDALREDVCGAACTDGPGETELAFPGLALREDVRRWDLEEGNLYELTVSLYEGEHAPGEGAGRESGPTEADGKWEAREAAFLLTDEKTVTFGVRDFGDNGEGRLAVNGRVFFLRGEANCAVFPETGHPPMAVEAWLDILGRYRSYGVNCMRFHSHCPPEAAFAAADRMGMLMQPELSHWNPRDAFESDESFACYRTELLCVLGMLANHPSFVMLTFGNELQAGEKGHERMRQLLRLAKETDPTRLYSDSSNGHYGAIGCDAENDFYSSFRYYEEDLRGTYDGMNGYINRSYPNAETDFGRAMARIREVSPRPVFGFEVGQFEILPDFAQLEDFQGISDPANLRLVRDRVRERGMEPVWKRYVEATGELSLIGYREESEAAMRTGTMSGLSLLGLQDFPGQGTALVGMMDSHLKPKPYSFADPERFRRFFRDRLPLVLLPKYTWENTETLRACLKIANFGKEELAGQPEWTLWMPSDGGAKTEAGRIAASGRLPFVKCPAGRLTDAGTLETALDELAPGSAAVPVRLELTVRLGECVNCYPLWVYLAAEPSCPADVYETAYLDETAKEVLQKGGKVYLAPPSVKEALPQSIQAQFTTDFWSVGTFPSQEGGMGQLIDEKHPLFAAFPTEFHTNWQWWPMAVQRAVILPERYEAIVTEMDSYAFLRPMAQLLECRCGNGRLLFSSFGLQDLQQYPEARALLAAIYRYMDSERFCPEQEIGPEIWDMLVRPVCR